MIKKSSIYHLPVGNGDMTLLKIASNNRYFYVLVDMYIRQSCTEKDDQCNVLDELHNLLEKDSDGRPYLDALVITHPDKDHIGGFEKYFYQGSPSNYTPAKSGEKDLIFIREIWSSPLIFRRKRKNHSLCEDAKAFNTEAKRRVELYRESKSVSSEGNRIRLIGEDIDGKTDDILDIVYKPEDIISKINEVSIKELTINIYGPLSDDEFEDSEALDKNRSSVILRWGIASHGYSDPTNFILLAGDASVEAWEIIWRKYKDAPQKLSYDLLLAPHHCSWHTLSHDSYSKSANPKVSESAKQALSQARTGAVIISSSDPIKDDDNDPPNFGAKREYDSIVSSANGTFLCLAGNVVNGEKAPSVLEYRLTNEGPQKVSETSSADSTSSAKKRTAATSSLIGHSGQAIGHG